MPNSAFPAATVDEHVERLQDVPTILNGEQLYSPAGLAKALQNVPGSRGGMSINGSTIFRFITKARTVNGVPIRLEAVRVGSRWLTSVEAFGRYIAKLTAASLPSDTPTPTPAPTPRQRQQAVTKASAQADKVFGKAKSGE
jgi:hypothetical protein